MSLSEHAVRIVTSVVLLTCGLAALCQAAPPPSQPAGRIIGMYVHQHWPYNHPYAARTWTLEDWRGYADGLRKLGYNTVLIWPVLETTPNPLTPSDRANIEKIASVIDMLHKEMQMRVYLTLCPNVGCRNEEAARATFEKRHFFYCDTRVNPGDPTALKRLIDWRETQFRPLAAADGVAIIDSDPGGYAGSTSAEFVNLLAEHRKMFDRLRPGIELWYWMHVGWEGYCRFYKTGRFSWGTPEEQLDTLSRLKAINPEPWGIANGLQYAEKLGIANRVISFNYGRIEGEPSFPMTNFGGDTAYTGGQGGTSRGVMGNAQTHCLQLPNTFAFVRGATGKPLTDADYVRFADDLLTGQGSLIVDAWRAMPGTDTARMQGLADKLEALPDSALKPGPLKGLLFGNPRRFVTDLVMQLRLRAAYESFLAATRSNADPKEAFSRFVTAVDTWQRQHGYENAWWWPGLDEALRKLNSPAINAVLGTQFNIESGPDPKSKESPFEQVQADLRRTESYTTRLIEAMRKAQREMK
jgi:hypothetical protein